MSTSSAEEDMQDTATGNQNEYFDDDTQLFKAELCLDPTTFVLFPDKGVHCSSKNALS